MNRNIWIPVAVTVAALTIVSFMGGGRAVGTSALPGVQSAAAAVWRQGATALGHAAERVSADAWITMHARPRAGLTIPEVPGLPLDVVAWMSLALAVFAFVRALQFSRGAAPPHGRVLALARRGIDDRHIARRTRLAHDAVRSLLQPGGQWNGRTSRKRLPIGSFRRRRPASDAARAEGFNTMS